MRKERIGDTRNEDQEEGGEKDQRRSQKKKKRWMGFYSFHEVLRSE